MGTILSWLGSHSTDVLALVASAVTGLAGRFINGHVKNANTRAILERATTEVVDAAKMTGKVYVDALKKASADGKLTPAERHEAKAKALAATKSNLGAIGLKRLDKAIGKGVSLDAWLETKMEAAVADLKKPK